MTVAPPTTPLDGQTVPETVPADRLCDEVCELLCRWLLTGFGDNAAEGVLAADRDLASAGIVPRAAERPLHIATAALRSVGVTWRMIGAVRGVSQHGARTRFRASSERLASQFMGQQARRASLNKKWTDPAFAGWRQDMRAAASERMKARHKDPAKKAFWEETRSKVLQGVRRKWTQEDYRIDMAARASWRYAEKTGMFNVEGVEAARAGSASVLREANRELFADQAYQDLWYRLQSRYRAEHPYDGPQSGTPYLEYLSQLGTAVATAPEFRAYCDDFMARAIPRAAASRRKSMDQGRRKAPAASDT